MLNGAVRPSRPLPARLALLLLLLAAPACVGPQRAEHRNLCPGESPPRCMSEEICAFDSGRSCYVCSCLDPEAGPQKPGWVPEIPGPPPPSP